MEKKLSNLELWDVYKEVITHGRSFISTLTTYEKSQLLKFSTERLKKAWKISADLFNSNPNYSYPEKYRKGTEFQFWLDESTDYQNAKWIVQVLTKNLSPKEATSEEQEYNIDNNHFIVTGKIETLFESISKYKTIMELLVSKKYVSPHTYVWMDDTKGNKGYLAALVKDLHGKGYYKDKKRPSNEQIKKICKESFGWEVGIDTIKKVKAKNFDFKFIPVASTIK